MIIKWEYKKKQRGTPKKWVSPDKRKEVSMQNKICNRIFMIMFVAMFLFYGIYLLYPKYHQRESTTPPPKTTIKSTTQEITTETTETTTEATTEEEQNTPPDLEIPLSNDIQSFIYEKCDYDDELYCLILAVIKQESDFDHGCRSEDGHDRGLMQLRDYYYSDWIEQYNVSDPEEIHDNLTVGITMLKEYLEKYEYKNLALMCYNCGEYGAKSLWRQDTYSTNYTEKIFVQTQ